VRKPAALFAALILLVGCNPDDAVHHVGWFATMRHQRSIRPYVMPRPSVPGTVPVTGAEVDLIGLDQGGRTTTADRLVNPRARTSESLDRGKWVYETYCLVCHGESGRGDGPIAAASGGPFVGVRSLVTDTMARRSDGYIYGVVIHAPSMGRGLMPIYGDKIFGADRWDVVNYVRSLQQQARAGGRP
jgi:mono/diheme cytochrome c family protein